MYFHGDSRERAGLDEAGWGSTRSPGPMACVIAGHACTCGVRPAVPVAALGCSNYTAVVLFHVCYLMLDVSTRYRGLCLHPALHSPLASIAPRSRARLGLFYESYDRPIARSRYALVYTIVSVTDLHRLQWRCSVHKVGFHAWPAFGIWPRMT